jgi:hypothetical protein
MAESQKKRSPIGRMLGGLLLVALICGFIGFAGASLLAVSAVFGEIGSAADDLSTTERFTLGAYLISQAPALDSPAGDSLISRSRVVRAPNRS